MEDDGERSPKQQANPPEETVALGDGELRCDEFLAPSYVRCDSGWIVADHDVFLEPQPHHSEPPPISAALVVSACSTATYRNHVASKTRRAVLPPAPSMSAETIAMHLLAPDSPRHQLARRPVRPRLRE